jgi:hypothetical protein
MPGLTTLTLSIELIEIEKGLKKCNVKHNVYYGLWSNFENCRGLLVTTHLEPSGKQHLQTRGESVERRQGTRGEWTMRWCMRRRGGLSSYNNSRFIAVASIRNSPAIKRLRNGSQPPTTKIIGRIKSPCRELGGDVEAAIFRRRKFYTTNNLQEL